MIPGRFWTVCYTKEYIVEVAVDLGQWLVGFNCHPGLMWNLFLGPFRLGGYAGQAHPTAKEVIASPDSHG